MDSTLRLPERRHRRIERRSGELRLFSAGKLQPSAVQSDQPELLEYGEREDKLLRPEPETIARLGGLRVALARHAGALRAQGIRVAAVFMGENTSVPAANAIYGRDLARIRRIDQLAAAAGRLIQDEIRELSG